MTKFLLPIILVISLVFNAYFGLKNLPQKPSTPTPVTVTRVIDGDTFITDKNITIRLAGIDAPEYPQNCLSGEAKDRLEKLILNKQVSLTNEGDDHFGRSVAYVFLDKLSIDEILLREGLGTFVGKNKNYQVALTQAENEAKTLRKGIWGDLCNPSADCKIKGIKRQTTGVKVYHLPNCYNYQKATVDINKGDRWFCTEVEAKKAGFSRSLDCPGSK